MSGFKELEPGKLYKIIGHDLSAYQSGIIQVKDRQEICKNSIILFLKKEYYRDYSATGIKLYFIYNNKVLFFIFDNQYYCLRYFEKIQ